MGGPSSAQPTQNCKRETIPNLEKGVTRVLPGLTPADLTTAEAEDICLGRGMAKRLGQGDKILTKGKNTRGTIWTSAGKTGYPWNPKPPTPYTPRTLPPNPSAMPDPGLDPPLVPLAGSGCGLLLLGQAEPRPATVVDPGEGLDRPACVCAWLHRT